MTNSKTTPSPFWRFSFLLYCAILLWLLFGRSNGWVAGLSYQEQLKQNTNLTPLYTIRNYLYVLQNPTNSYLTTHCFINLAGNILLFIPAGWLLPKLWKWQRNFLHFFVSCLGAVFCVEVLQLFTLLGSFDVDDIILNLLGMTVGFLGYTVFAKK